MAAKDDYLIDTLIDLGYVTHEQVASVQADAAATGEGVIDLLITRKVIPAMAVTQAKATYFNAEVVTLSETRLADEVLASIPRHVAKRYRVVPVYRHDGAIGVALSDPSDLDTIDALHHLLRLEIEPKVASDEEIDAALNKYYGASDDSVGKMIQDITEGEVETAAGAVDDGGTVDADAPIIKLVNQIIVEAYKMRASDIHLEPLAKSFRVRYRI
ncbi:MAG TPA: hypothetical protein VK530_15990, partial [Candidatus Acidoferrum sp.]|nr:hypothetical protein [Candidatus Acidoferrum sp.]